jgi:hypothetical protein
MVRPARAGVPERRWESGGWWFIVGSGAWLCAYAMVLVREDSSECVGGGVGIGVVLEPFVWPWVKVASGCRGAGVRVGEGSCRGVCEGLSPTCRADVCGSIEVCGRV